MQNYMMKKKYIKCENKDVHASKKQSALQKFYDNKPLYD